MIALNKEWLDNLIIKMAIRDLNAEECVTDFELGKIRKMKPIGLYAPNTLVRIGLFILTIICVVFSSGLLALLFLASGGDQAISILSIFVGLVAYGSLEVMVVRKHHYKSGVDDALMWLCLILILLGVNVAGQVPGIINSTILCLMAGFFYVRFLNSLMAVVSFVAFLGIVFYSVIMFGDLGRMAAPFILMAVSLIVYFFARKYKDSQRWYYHRTGLLMVEVVSLICFCAAGNYYIVREGYTALFRGGSFHSDIYFEIIFWFLTVTIPSVYIFLGIRQKNAILLRTGLVLVPFIFLTFRFYYNLLPIEIAFTIAGIILIILAYLLIRYLREPKHGFTDKEISNGDPDIIRQMEAIAIATGFQRSQNPASGHTEFGGGSGGGGGAGAGF